MDGESVCQRNRRKVRLFHATQQQQQQVSASVSPTPYPGQAFATDEYASGETTPPCRQVTHRTAARKKQKQNATVSSRCCCLDSLLTTFFGWCWRVQQAWPTPLRLRLVLPHVNFQSVPPPQTRRKHVRSTPTTPAQPRTPRRDSFDVLHAL